MNVPGAIRFLETRDEHITDVTMADEKLRALSGPLIRRRGPSGPVVLSASRCRAYGVASGGLTEVLGDGLALLSRLEVSFSSCDEVIETPYALERRWTGTPGLTERTFLVPDAPGIVVEWCVEGTDRRKAFLSWTVPDATRWRVHSRSLVTRDPDGQRRVFLVEPAPDWTVEQVQGALRVEARILISASASTTLTAMVRGATPSARRRDMRPFHRIEAQQVRARSDVERAREDGLVVETSDPTVSQALSWAIDRLGTLLSVHTAARTPRLSPSAALLAGLGAAVTGEFGGLAILSAAGPVVLRDLARAWDGRDEVGSNKDAPDSLAMILSRFEAREGGLVQLRRPGAIDQALAPYENWLEGWHRFDAGDAEEGTRVLDGLLAVGIRNGLAWGLSERGAEDVGLTALIPTTVVYGVLGARPDAGVGRLKLAPQLPAAWGAVTVRNLRMADSRVSMAYRQTGSRHIFALEQTRGAVPINLVFEPTVPGKAVRAAYLDGKRVELDEIASRNRVGVRLQLPLDGPREIAILVGKGARDPR